MKLTYWLAAHKTDHPCYGIREKTKRACAEKRAAYGEQNADTLYEEPRKIVITYTDGFDLMRQITSEGWSEGSHTVHNEEKIKALAESIKKNGIKGPYKLTVGFPGRRLPVSEES